MLRGRVNKKSALHDGKFDYLQNGVGLSISQVVSPSPQTPWVMEGEMDSSRSVGGINPSHYLTFDNFCDELNIKGKARKMFKDSLVEDECYIDLGQVHGGVFEAAVGIDHLRKIQFAVRETQEQDASRKAKQRAQKRDKK